MQLRLYEKYLFKKSGILFYWLNDVIKRSPLKLEQQQKENL